MNERDPVSDLLKTWRIPPAESSHFSHAVWRRIHSAETQQRELSPGAFALLARVFRIPAEQFRWALPVAAGLVVMASIAAGTTAAHVYDSQRRTELMASAHARSIDPLLMADASGPTGHRHP